MKSIEELAQVQGIVLACEFSPDGTLLKYEAHMEAPRELAEKAAQYIATVSMMFKTLSDAFSKESEMKWTPQRFWTYQGGDYTVICSGNKAVFAETFKLDLNKVVELLSEKRVEEPTRQSI